MKEIEDILFGSVCVCLPILVIISFSSDGFLRWLCVFGIISGSISQFLWFVKYKKE